jgi:hypothetical protein
MKRESLFTFEMPTIWACLPMKLGIIKMWNKYTFVDHSEIQCFLPNMLVTRTRFRKSSRRTSGKFLLKINRFPSEGVPNQQKEYPPNRRSTHPTERVPTKDSRKTDKSAELKIYRNIEKYWAIIYIEILFYNRIKYYQNFLLVIYFILA